MPLDLIVSREGIHEADKFVAHCRVNHLVYVGHQEAIFGAGLVQAGEDDADTPLPTFLSHQN